MKLLLLSLTLPFLMLSLTGCASSSIETRRQERLTAYASLSPEEKQMVDSGQIRLGMSTDGVYIAWGPPSEVLEHEDQKGHQVIWRYHGTWMQETRYWSYREVSRNGAGSDVYLERYLATDFTPRDYARAEIVFVNNKVVSWRTLPRPVY